jgi:SAM-dependent methyltransferase
MQRYYSDKLSAERLRRVYEIAPPRIRQYLEAEIDYVLGNFSRGDFVLEIGCGFGRVLKRLSTKAGIVAGLDTSLSSLQMASRELKRENCLLFCMDAAAIGFADNVFDVAVCVQNGISAFKVDQETLLHEAIRVTCPGGVVLFSSYSEKFWDDRLKWFRLQAEEHLLGEIDYTKTGNGIIICKDGFKATTVTPDNFRKLASTLDKSCQIIEIDNSSIFCKIIA